MIGPGFVGIDPDQWSVPVLRKKPVRTGPGFSGSILIKMRTGPEANHDQSQFGRINPNGTCSAAHVAYRPGPWARCGGHAGPRTGVASGSGWLQAGRCATQAFPGTLRPRACNPKRHMAQAQGCILRPGPTAHTRQCQSPQATAPAITRHPTATAMCVKLFFIYISIS